MIYVDKNPKDIAISFYHFHYLAKFLPCGRLKDTDSAYTQAKPSQAKPNRLFLSLPCFYSYISGT